MNVSLTQYHDSEMCTWCERTKECVTADFDDGFLQKVPLCWACLQQAVKVRNKQRSKAAVKDKAGS